MKTNQDKIKNKASKFISLVSGLTEKTIHSIVDKSTEVSSVIEEAIIKAYNDLHENLEDWVANLKEKQVDELENGDLVISPVDILINGSIKYKVGEVFELNVNEARFIKTPLFLADVKIAVKWARLNQIQQTLDFINQDSDEIPTYLVVQFLENKMKELNKKEEEPVNETTT